MRVQLTLPELRQLGERCQEKAEIEVHPNAAIFNSAITAVLLFFFPSHGLSSIMGDPCH